MQDENPGEGASTPESTASQPNEELVEATSDGWGDAEEAFNSPDGEPEPKTQQTKLEGDPKSHLEQGNPDPLQLDDLAVPHKYKPLVQERIQKISSEFQSQVQAANSETEQVRGAANGLLEVFREIATNPNRMADYIVEHGEKIGIDPQVIQQYSNLKNKPSQNQTQEGTPPQGPPAAMDQIFGKYAERLVNTQDPNEFVGTLKSLMTDTVGATRSEMEGIFKQLLGGYHQEFVNPFLEDTNKQKATAEFEVRRSNWNSAETELKDKYPDFPKYREVIKDKLKNDPKWSRFRVALNKGEEGLAHSEVLEDLYHLVSRNDQLAAAKAPKPKFAGLEPNSKHITTKKTGGSDWDEIEEDIWK